MNNSDNGDHDAESVKSDTLNANAAELDQVVGMVSNGEITAHRMVVSTDSGDIEITAEQGRLVLK